MCLIDHLVLITKTLNRLTLETYCIKKERQKERKKKKERKKNERKRNKLPISEGSMFGLGKKGFEIEYSKMHSLLIDITHFLL